jgi:predicted outer membrane repeat protein
MENINERSKKLMILTVFVILFFIFLSTTNAVEHDLISSDNLGEAITNASDGDTINLDTGTYTNNVTNMSINKNLTINGKDPKTTIIDAQNLGRIFNIQYNGTLTLINITLINGNATDGGAIYNNGGRLTLINCRLTNNQVTEGSVGGAIYNGGNVNISKSEFRNNIANSGGAIFNNGTLQINNTNFTANNASYGGAINTIMVTIINNSNFSNNTGRQGGAIRNGGSNANLTVNNSTFSENQANINVGLNGNGGAIVNTNGNVNISNSAFNQNTAENNGAAIWNNAIISGTLNINNSTFINNTATNIGGAIYTSESINTNVSNSSFINNAATVGGAIYNTLAINTTVMNSIFINNTANNGAAIYNPVRASMNVYSSKFTNNSATINGGAILNDGDMIVDLSNFTSNTALNGSAIYTGTTSSLKVTNSNLTNNKGGATLNINGINTSITSTNIFNNTQGVIISYNAVNTTLNHNRIFNNTNTTGFDLENNGLNTNTNLNWWGANTPAINGVALDNYFIMNITNATQLNSNGRVIFNYRFGLNTGEDADSSLLPYFVTNVRTGSVSSFDARFDRPVTITLNTTGNIIYSFVTDNEIQNLEGLITEPDDNETDKNNDTDNNNKNNDTDDNNNNKDTDNNNINEANATNDPIITSAAMKETGIPINLLLTILLSLICFGYYRKQ